MTTPNTIKRFSLLANLEPQGAWVWYDDHLAALSRARAEARREALEEAARDVCAWCGSRNMLNGKPSPALIGPNAAGNYTHKSERGEVLCAASAIYSRIRFEDSNHA